MKKMGKILPVEAVVGAAMLKNKGWLRGRVLKTRLCHFLALWLGSLCTHH